MGIDSSYSMLESARHAYASLENTTLQSKFLCIDFSRIDFQDKLDSYVEPFNKKVFALMGGTIGNIQPTNIVDTLYNMMNKDWKETRLSDSYTSCSGLAFYIRRLFID